MLLKRILKVNREICIVNKQKYNINKNTIHFVYPNINRVSMINYFINFYTML